MILRQYQLDAIQGVYDRIIEGAKAPLIAMPTGCHAAGTMILMFDGSERAVENVVVGDLIMGPDSRPRRVLSLAGGHEDMFEIVPTKGEPFVVNIGHILSLATTNEGKPHNCCQDGTRIDNVTVREWLSRSKHWKHLRKLHRAAVDFPPIAEPTIDPWFAGVMIGDGSLLTSPNLTNMDADVIAKCNAYAESLGCYVRRQTKPNNKASTYRYVFEGAHRANPNPLTKLLRDNNLWGNIHCHKHLPHHFKVGSKETRLQLLAGLIDSDGYLDTRGNHVDYVTSSERLAKDIQFVSRSLGLAAYVVPCQKSCQNGYVGSYYRVSISGELMMLPLVRRHRRPSPRRQKKRHNVTGFTARYVGKDHFYGFSLDGDHLYLTSDFIVHHNTGKSLVLAGLVKRTCTEYPHTRHIILSHVKELLEQDAKAIRSIWPQAPVGMFSSGLNRRDVLHPILVGGCASVRNCVDRFGHRDFCIIDEAHLLSPTAETTYQKIIAKLRERNPNLIVVGLTATPYRRGIGSLLNGGIFDSVAIDLTDAKSWARFIAEGHLVALHAKRTDASIDVSGVKISNGDFAEGALQAVSDKDQLNESIAKEIAVAMRSRKAALVFCAGVEHAEHMAERLNAVGVKSRAVHSKMPTGERDTIVAAFKRGGLDCVTNNNVLSTGFDHPAIDLIGMARATVSVGLWVQMLGRGTRPAPGKTECLVLDFAGNRPRLGPVDAPHIPSPKKGEKTGEIPCKICDSCGCYAHISARICEACGEPFPIATKLKHRPGSEAIMSGEAPVIETFNVSRVTYARHARKIDGAISVRVTYMCGYKHFSTWINFDAKKTKHFAHNFWRQFVGDDIPETNDDALALLSRGVAVTPKKVRVWTNKQYPEVMGYEM